MKAAHLPFALLLLSASCSRHIAQDKDQPPVTGMENKSTVNTPSKDTLPKTSPNNSSNTSGFYAWQTRNCPRGIPQPVLNKNNPNIVGSSYSLEPSAGIEKVLLFSQDSLIIEGKGCNYYELDYILKTAVERDPSDLSFWLMKASDLMLGFQDAKAPFDFQGLAAKTAELSKQKDIRLEKEYTLIKEGTQSEKLILEAITKQPAGKGSILRFKIFVGPL